MKTPLRQKWALYIASNSRSRFMPYFAFTAAVGFGVWAWTASSESYWGAPFGFFMFWIAATVLYFERRAFAELLAMKDAEIRRLQDQQKTSA